MSGDETWTRPPADLRLAPEEVHIWRMALDPPDAALNALAATLSADEHGRAARFYFERDRRRFVAGRGGLRAILGRYLGQAPESLAFTYGAYGKPALQPECPLAFNLAHSDALALCAVAWERAVGIDVEELKPLPDALSIASRFFAPAEHAHLQAVPPADLLPTFYRYWTRKEAYLKACSLGLSLPPEQVELDLAADPPRLLRIAGDTAEAARWSLHPLAPAPGYLGALVVAGAPTVIRYWQVDD